ncbi:MAG: ABC transporter permease [Clostridiales bacterium]|nr:ABC transporter permease [Clostridiales bacterium]
MKKYQNIKDKMLLIGFNLIILAIWEIAVDSGWIERFILPSPSDVIISLWVNSSEIFKHTKVTLFEGLVGLVFAIAFSFLMAILMDQVKWIKKIMYPMLVISQTVPIIIIAPLVAMWFGFGIAPKVFVVVLVCFFPITISLIDGLQSVDFELINLLKSMGATKMEIFLKVKFPFTLPGFFSGLKIAATYSIMGAVIGEWLGGKSGLGVYMLRARHSFSLDKVFASIVVIILLSISIFYLISILQKIIMPWAKFKEEK